MAHRQRPTKVRRRSPWSRELKAPKQIALRVHFPMVDEMVAEGRRIGLAADDVIDEVVASWSGATDHFRYSNQNPN
ncbi:hypothetical protein [Telmatospirillum sp.]|uniref:hypothetical protein n=1 Tax=Telmatospirillum sp. TaxID=2079197 RepID=UPI00284C3996|nr:hypothetical protein [Telmatospirillum sp.]MDR3436324.1 hypothetical protein [Telmatospirillum sp.]